jgi:H+-translocating NAD(P) transhydrogenase subunit alpha
MTADLWTALFIGILAAFVGYEVISRVPVLLHTPLMSGSNFIHGIVLVGGIVVLGLATTPLEEGVGLVAVIVLPIGGADMPVVISLLNAFTGLSAAATGSRSATRR